MNPAVGFFDALLIAFGAMMWAVAFTVLIGRWVTADENTVGLLWRGGLLLVLFAVGFTHFMTVWYYLCLLLILLVMVDELGIPGLAPLWVRHRRGARLSAAVGKAIEQPKSPFPRIDLARGLLETGQFEAGLAELEHAKALADDGNRKVIGDMVAEVEGELLQTCAACGGVNAHTALACRYCFRCLVQGLTWSFLIACSRPGLRLLQRLRRVAPVRAR